jgi:hypothetical protein
LKWSDCVYFHRIFAQLFKLNLFKLASFTFCSLFATMSSSEDVNYSSFYSETFQIENKNFESKRKTFVPSMKEFHVLQHKIKCLSIFVQNSSLFFFLKCATSKSSALVPNKNVSIIIQRIIDVDSQSLELSLQKKTKFELLLSNEDFR